MTFYPNGGVLVGDNFGTDNKTSNAHAITLNYGSPAYSSIGKATRDRYDFLGWFATDGTQVYDANGVCVKGTSYWDVDGKWSYSGNVSLYARWKGKPHTVTFNPNGGVLVGDNFGRDRFALQGGTGDFP